MESRWRKDVIKIAEKQVEVPLELRQDAIQRIENQFGSIWSATEIVLRRNWDCVKTPLGLRKVASKIAERRQ